MEATGLLTDWFTAVYEDEDEDKCQLYRETHFKTLTENGDVWKSGRALRVTLHMLRGASSDNNLNKRNNSARDLVTKTPSPASWLTMCELVAANSPGWRGGGPCMVAAHHRARAKPS